jgi:microcystin-dependent protein
MSWYLGEIRMFAGRIAPRNWAFCDGRELPIDNTRELFDLIGTTYGGNGTSMFKLPDLRGRVPINQGTRSGRGTYGMVYTHTLADPGPTYALGQAGGVEEVTLTADQLPAHTHTLMASEDVANTRSPAGNALAKAAGTVYTSNPGRGLAPLATSAIAPNAGAGAKHTNMQPFVCTNFIIALEGGVPSANAQLGETGEPFIGEIRMFSFGFSHRSWAPCDGRLISDRNNPVLFGVLNPTTPGNTVALPTFEPGRIPIGSGQGTGLTARRARDQGGEQMVTLDGSQLPAHTHQMYAATEAGQTNLPAGAFTGTGSSLYATSTNPQPMAQSLAPNPSIGTNASHNNLMPYLTVYFCIALEGLFPSG